MLYARTKKREKEIITITAQHSTAAPSNPANAVPGNASSDGMVLLLLEFLDGEADGTMLLVATEEAQSGCRSVLPR